MPANIIYFQFQPENDLFFYVKFYLTLLVRKDASYFLDKIDNADHSETDPN